MSSHPSADRIPADQITLPGPDGTSEPLTAASIERFWAEGETAYPASPASTSSNQNSCCAGIDTPGVGIVHAATCNLAGRPYVAGEVPQPLRTHVDQMDEPSRDRRDVLLIGLIFESRRLAERRLHVTPIGARCFECGGVAQSFHAEIEHMGDCPASSVLNYISLLQQLVVLNGGAA
jgi:hypothetical protein